MTDPILRQCIACHETAPLDDLSEIVEIRSGRVFHVHRPSTQKPCFRWKVAGSSVHRIVNREVRA